MKDLYKVYSAGHMLAGSSTAPGSCTTGEDMAHGKQNVRSSVTSVHEITAVYANLQAL